MASARARARCRIGLPAAGLALLLALPASVDAQEYEVLTMDGRSIAVEGLSFADELLHLETPDGVVELPGDDVDYHGTFWANADKGLGNTIWFNSGGFMRYEALEFEAGRVIVSLGQDRTVALPEALVDFRACVLEGGTVVVPARSGGALVAKAVSRTSRADRRTAPGDRQSVRDRTQGRTGRRTPRSAGR